MLFLVRVEFLVSTRGRPRSEPSSGVPSAFARDIHSEIDALPFVPGGRPSSQLPCRHLLSPARRQGSVTRPRVGWLARYQE